MNENEDKDSEIDALKDTVAELQNTMMGREDKSERERAAADRHAQHLQDHKCALAFQQLATKLWSQFQQRCARSLTGGIMLLRGHMVSLTPRPDMEAIMPRDSSAARMYGQDSRNLSRYLLSALSPLSLLALSCF